jgi:4'-phosphopantetheinyl transferase
MNETTDIKPPAVAVFACALDVPADRRRELAACLEPGERDRVARLRSERDRARVLVARGWRRHVLAARLGADPAELRFVADARGKPRLADDPVHFSASRSGSLALLAVCVDREVGVDVEAIERHRDIERLAGRIMSAREREAFAELAPDDRRAAMFACWARKEAYVKATGEGLVFPLDRTTVWAGDDRTVTVDGWLVQGLAVAPGCAAALAVRSGSG